MILSIVKGQLMCGHGSCPVMIRWGDGDPITLNGSPAADGSTEHIFIPGYKNFIRNMGKFKRVRIQVGIYQNGSHVFDFDTAGFDASRFD